MKIQVLVSTMNKTSMDFLEKMNISTDSVVANQNGTNSIEIINKEDKKITVICNSDVGLSNNRNITLAYSTADICLLADDDIEYVDNYDKIVKRSFDEKPEADILIFNLYETPVRRYVIKKEFKVGWLNYLKFGSVRIAFRRKSIINNGIIFDAKYGAGAEIPMGEDNIFLHDCLKQGLKILACPEYILTLKNDRESTWFHGFDDEYFINKSKLYRRLNPLFWKLMCLQDVARHINLYGRNFNSIMKLMLN